MFRSLSRRALAAVVVSTVAVVPLAYGSGSTLDSRLTGRIGEVALDEHVLLTPDLIRAFVPTGSKSGNCLVTLRESTIADSIGSPVFCGPRTVGGVNGVLITVWLDEELSDMYLPLTVYQQSARTYGTPMLYTGT